MTEICKKWCSLLRQMERERYVLDFAATEKEKEKNRDGFP
jgi:hypothetical protein